MKHPPLTPDEKRAFYSAKRNKERGLNPVKGKWRIKFEELESVFELLLENIEDAELRNVWRQKAGLEKK